jgi:hypothetical protein
MLHIAYYDSTISNFCSTNESEVLGQLTEKHGFALEIQQRIAWQGQINLLKDEQKIFLKVIFTLSSQSLVWGKELM